MAVVPRVGRFWQQPFWNLLAVQRWISLVLLCWVLGEVAGLWPSRLIERLEWMSYDWRVQATLSGEADPAIVLVDLDERSLAAIGQWPWPRITVAELIERLFLDYQISLLGIDVVFAEPEADPLALIWPQLHHAYPDLPAEPPRASGDDLLAQVMAQFPVITGFYFQSRVAEQDPPASGQLPTPILLAPTERDWASLPWPRPERYTSNLALLQTSALGGGFFDNPLVDGDGVFRRVPLFQLWEGQLYPNLPLAMFYQLLGQPPVELKIEEAGGLLQLEGIDLGGFVLPTDGRSGALVPWYGERGHFNYVSAKDILLGLADPSLLEGALVILGASAPGLMDLRSTPVGSVYPGPEINATLLAGMLHQSFKAEPPFTLAAALLLLLALGLLMTYFFPRLQALAVFVISLLLMALHFGLNFWAWSAGWVLPLASGVVLLLLLAGWHMSMNFLRESRAKNWVTQSFGRYIPPELVAELVDHPEALKLEGEEREMTVLFSDVRGFTAFSETLAPSELTEVMNRLLTPITAAIHQQQGTIDKYMGDAVMAFWGAPLPHPEHARAALRGAFAMLEALKEINQAFVAEGKQALAMGIGLNTGAMNVGNMGSSFRMAYTVMGDNVNLGSRLEGLTKFYGVPILVSQTTRDAAPEFAYRWLDRVQVKGRAEPVNIYQPLGLSAELSAAQQAQLDAYHAALEAYQQADFIAAQAAFESLMLQQPELNVLHIYRERCQLYGATPPGEDWAGVWVHHEK